MQDLASYIEHTLLDPAASEPDIRRICAEAWEHLFKGICVAPSYVGYVKEMLEFCPIRIEIGTVISFPFGFSTTAAKIVECETALKDGATELDVVMNLSRFKSMAYLSVREELTTLANIAHQQNALFKVVVETSLLDLFELHTVSEICAEAKADYFCISTGNESVDVDKLKMIRSILPANVKIKVAGTVDNADLAQMLIKAGADRIGTSMGTTFTPRQ